MMVVARRGNGDLIFYMKPLGQGQEAQVLAQEPFDETEEMIPSTEILSADFVAIREDVVFFCITQG